MRRDLLEILRCPYTGSPVSLALASAETGSEISFGVIATAAGEFPILDGIIRLLSDELQDPIVELVKQGRHHDALTAAFDMPFSGMRSALVRLGQLARRLSPGRAGRLADLGKHQFHDLLTDHHQTFAEFTAKAGGWTDWQTYRFSMGPFLPVYALSHLAKGCRMVLDFGCGLGQSSFLIHRLASDATIVCADYSFTSLFLAKRYLVPDSPFVCLDGDFPLPFRSELFDLVFSTDALQYIESKWGLATEFGRVLAADGVVALAHLHNRLSPRRAGKALTPLGYEGLFDGMERRVYSEDEIVGRYASEGSLDLTGRRDVRELDAALDGVSLVAAKTVSPFRRYTGLHDDYIAAMRHPILNPVYSARQDNGAVVLDRKVDAPYAVERTLGGLEILPRQWRAERTRLDAGGQVEVQGMDQTQLRELIRRFLVVETPKEFACRR